MKRDPSNVLVFMVIASLAGRQSHNMEKPNILLIITDHQELSPAMNGLFVRY